MESLSARATSSEDTIESEKVATESGMDENDKAVSPFHDLYLTQKQKLFTFQEAHPSHTESFGRSSPEY
jgi:hypothetical protein